MHGCHCICHPTSLAMELGVLGCARRSCTHGADHVKGDRCMQPDILGPRPPEIQLHCAGFRTRTMVTRSECVEDLASSVKVIDQGHRIPTRMPIFSSMREASPRSMIVEYKRDGAGKLHQSACTRMSQRRQSDVPF